MRKASIARLIRELESRILKSKYSHSLHVRRGELRQHRSHSPRPQRACPNGDKGSSRRTITPLTGQWAGATPARAASQTCYPMGLMPIACARLSCVSCYARCRYPCYCVATALRKQGYRHLAKKGTRPSWISPASLVLGTSSQNRCARLHAMGDRAVTQKTYRHRRFHYRFNEPEISDWLLPRYLGIGTLPRYAKSRPTASNRGPAKGHLNRR